MIQSAQKTISLELQSTHGYLMLVIAHIKLNEVETAVDAIKIRLAKENEDMELKCLVLKHNKMLSNIYTL
eukprot:7589821-Ditylum_brightwellii.AAC.1